MLEEQADKTELQRFSNLADSAAIVVVGPSGVDDLLGGLSLSQLTPFGDTSAGSWLRGIDLVFPSEGGVRSRREEMVGP